MNESVECFLDELPAPLQSVTRRLQALLVSLAPAVREEFRWNIPFYSFHGALCYLNPQPKRGHVVLGFVRGTALSDPAGCLTCRGKTVRHVLLRTEAAVFEPAVLTLLQAALAANYNWATGGSGLIVLTRRPGGRPPLAQRQLYLCPARLRRRVCVLRHARCQYPNRGAVRRHRPA
ncbi:DUF1801 domain-containing protein [Hymenobacter terrenus]|uniref:DUF1801 domain-containing protein n=1 Tax=Hymenobacter terrenus TaxID=1629124 RepID=UPI0009082868